MDTHRIKKLLQTSIDAENKTREVRNVVKEYETRKQDVHDETS